MADEVIRINIEGAGQRTLDQILNAFSRFDNVVRDTVTATQRFNAAGERVSVTLKGIDASGSKVSRTFKEVDNTLRSTAATVQNSRKSFFQLVEVQNRLTDQIKKLSAEERRALNIQKLFVQIQAERAGATRRANAALSEEEKRIIARNNALREAIELNKRNAATQKAADAKAIDRAVSGGASQATIGKSGASQAEALNFQEARARLREFVKANELARGQILKIFNDVRAGIIRSYTGAKAEAQRQIIALINAQKQLGAEARRVATAQESAAARQVRASRSVVTSTREAAATTREFTLSWRSLLRILSIQVSSRLFFTLTNQLREATVQAKDFSIAIAEVQTIDTARQSFDTLEESLRGVSNAYGIDILETVEAQYQTLSNQVAEGADAFRFLDQAARFSLATNSELSDSVSLLTSAINSFGLEVADTERIAGVFFKTIEEGRVRASELANTFGRVGVPAKQLGVSIEETAAAISLLTIQGVKASEAQTLLRNILLKLIRPTDAMKETLADLGFSSGQAAIQTLGLGGTLAALEDSVDGSVDGIGELFGRIRAITGALVFAGDGMDRFNSILNETEDAGETFGRAVQLTTENAGRQAVIALNEVSNEFLKFGQAILVGFGEFIGGFENLLPLVKALIKQVKLLGIAIGITLVARGLKPLIAGLIATNIHTRRIIASNRLAGRSFLGMRIQINLAAKSLKAFALSNPFTAILLGVTLLVEAFDFVANAGTRALEEIAEEANRLNEILKENAEEQKKAARETTDSLKKEVQRRVRDELKGASDTRKAITSTLKNIEKFNEEATETAKERQKEFVEAIKKSAKDVETALKKSLSTLDSLRKQFKDVGDSAEGFAFEQSLEDAGSNTERIGLVDKRSAELLKRAQAASKARDAEELKRNLDGLKQLQKLRIGLAREAGEAVKDANKDAAEASKKEFEGIVGLNLTTDQTDLAKRILDLEEIGKTRKEALEFVKREAAAAGEVAKIQADINKLKLVSLDLIEKAFDKEKEIAEKLLEKQASDEARKTSLEGIAKQLEKVDTANIFNLDDGGADGVRSRIAEFNKLLSDQSRIRASLGLETAFDKQLTLERIRANNLKGEALISQERIKASEKVLQLTAKERIAFISGLQGAADKTKDRATDITTLFNTVIGDLEGATTRIAVGSEDRSAGRLQDLLTAAGADLFETDRGQSLDSLVLEIQKAGIALREAVKGTGTAEAAREAVARIRALRPDFGAFSGKQSEESVEFFKNFEKLAKLFDASAQDGGPGAVIRAADRMRVTINEFRKVTEENAKNQGRTAETQKTSVNKFDDAINKLTGSRATFNSAVSEYQKATTAFEKAVAKFGSGPRFHDGGTVPGGADNVPIVAQSGEFIVNRQDSQKFRSTLMAINSGQFKPRGFQTGGEVTSMGDFNISLESSGNTDTDVEAIGRALQTKVRNGTLDLQPKRRF